MADLRKLLSDDDCESILEEALKSKVFTLTRYHIQPFHKQLEGLIGEHYTLHIDLIRLGERKSMKFFLKTLNSNKTMLELSRTINVYEKEEFFYDLLKRIEKLGIDVSYAPKGYSFTNSSVVVLEDLSARGFKGTNKKDSLDMEHCKLCLETLAKFHASTFNYEDSKSSESRKYSLNEDYREILEEKFLSHEDNSATRYLKCAIKALFDLVDIVPDNELAFDREKFKVKLCEFLESVGASSTLSSSNCILHGDLWSSNFLYKYSQSNRPIEAKIVDYQTVSYGPPELDVMKFLMTNTRKDFRDDNLKKLARHYFEKLSALSARCRLRDWDEFWTSCRAHKLPAKVHAIVDRSITFMSDETYVDAMRSEESFARFLFEDRSKYVTRSFGTSPEFRALMLEDIRELGTILVF